MICGIYSLVLLYFGLKPMMKVPTEKFVAYFVVSLLAMAAVKWAIGLVLGILIGIFMVAA
jgi:hypothetical protein